MKTGQKTSVFDTADTLFSKRQHYYVRKDGHPIATVVVGQRQKSKRICRGIAICSTTQNFDREEGLKRATARMNAAAIRRGNSEVIQNTKDRKLAKRRVGNSATSVDRFVESIDAQESVKNFKWKSEFGAFPTDKETKLLNAK